MKLKTLKQEDYDKGIHEKIDAYNEYINIVNLFGTSDQKQKIENDGNYQNIKSNSPYDVGLSYRRTNKPDSTRYSY